MSLLSAVRVALAALLVNKKRSALTSLGIVIGTSAVIAMVAAGSGARRKLDERLESVGKTLILIRAGVRTNSGSIADLSPLTREDADAIRKQAGPLLVGVSESQLTQRLAASRTARWATSIAGNTPEIQRIRAWKLVHGRFYNDEDLKKEAPVCVLGATVRRRLFPDQPNPVGEMIRVGRLRVRVIGVLEEKGRSPLGADQDDQVSMPITTLQRKLDGEERIGTIVAAARSEQLLAKAKEEIVKLLRQRRHAHRAEAGDDFDVSTVRELSELALVVTATLQALVAVIASVSLLVGGIGIMNIMLVSVTERTREIGIRMAVGATGLDVLIQFLIEALVLALAGGTIGISLGVAGAVGLACLAQWPVVISPLIVLLSFAVAALVGIFFGYYPALQASRLDPIEALRYE